MVGALPPFVALRVTTCPLIAVLGDVVYHRYQTNHCSVVEDGFERGQDQIGFGYREFVLMDDFIYECSEK